MIRYWVVPVIASILILGTLGITPNASAAPGDFIVTDSGFVPNSNFLLRVTPGGTVSVITSGGLGLPQGIAIDWAGNFIVADASGQRLLRITPGGTVSLIATNFIGVASGVAIDSAGDFIVTNGIGSRIIKVTPDGVVTVITSSGLGIPLFLAIEPQQIPIGGTSIPIDTTALLVAGAQTISHWLILGVLSAVGIGLAVFTIKRSR